GNHAPLEGGEDQFVERLHRPPWLRERVRLLGGGDLVAINPLRPFWRPLRPKWFWHTHTHRDWTGPRSCRSWRCSAPGRDTEKTCRRVWRRVRGESVGCVSPVAGLRAGC